MADAGDGKTAVAAGDGGEKKRQEQSAAFHELFSFADRWDCLLMAAGSVGAVVHGSAMPVFFLLFGDLVNGFGKNQTHLSVMTHEVSKVRLPCHLPSPFEKISPVRLWFSNALLHLSFQYALYFVYLGLVVCLSSYAGESVFLVFFSHRCCFFLN